VAAVASAGVLAVDCTAAVVQAPRRNAMMRWGLRMNGQEYTGDMERDRYAGAPGPQEDSLPGIRLTARSAIAVIVSDGFTPGLADTVEPSIT
jgi:hypothetical protein